MTIAKSPTKLAEILLYAWWETDDIYYALADDTFVWDQDADGVLGDTNFAAAEISGGDYVAGGQLLTTTGLEVVGASNKVRLKSDPVLYVASDIGPARFGIIYRDIGFEIVVVQDFESDQQSIGTDFSVTAPTDGWLFDDTD